MNTPPRVVTDNDTLQAIYEQLAPGDAFIGRLRLNASEEHLLLDLVERGIQLFPSALAQLTSRSKAMQARLFAQFMLPHTRAIHDRHLLMATVSLYNKEKIGKVVTKLDRANCGNGVLLWNSVEEVYNQATLGALPYPFVLQPFAQDSHDIRVIMLGEYTEAYQRSNPDNFRHNLHCGGNSLPCDLSADQQVICRAVMERGLFPYGHLDLMVTPDGTTYLAEINLRGGIRGARIGAGEYRKKIAALHDRAHRHLLDQATP